MKHFPHVRQIFNLRIGKPESEKLTGHGLYCFRALRELGKTAEQPANSVDERSRAKAYGLSAVSAPPNFAFSGDMLFASQLLNVVTRETSCVECRQHSEPAYIDVRPLVIALLELHLMLIYNADNLIQVVRPVGVRSLLYGELWIFHGSLILTSSQ